MILRNNYAIYNTLESDGDDVCIVDECGRWTVINSSDWKQFVKDVFNYDPNVVFSVGTTFKEMTDEFQEDLQREFNSYENRRNL